MAQQDKGRTRDVDNIVGGYQNKLVINVRTVPNGYTLDIEKGEKKQGFMYFNPKKLLDGFMYHVGFEELGEVSEEFRAEVMKAAIAWQDNGKLVKLNLKYEAKIKELKTRIATHEKQLCKKKAKEDADDEPKKHRGKGKPKEKVEKLIASNTVL